MLLEISVKERRPNFLRATTTAWPPAVHLLTHIFLGSPSPLSMYKIYLYVAHHYICTTHDVFRSCLVQSSLDLFLSSYSVKGGVGRCYPFWLEFSECVVRKRPNVRYFLNLHSLKHWYTKIHVHIYARANRVCVPLP